MAILIVDRQLTSRIFWRNILRVRARHRLPTTVLVFVFLVPMIAENAKASAVPRPTATTRFKTLDELLAVAPKPPASEELANQLMDKYSSDPNFVDVYIDGPSDIRVVLKGATETDTTVGAINVRTVGANYSMNELNEFSAALIASNPRIQEVRIDGAASSLTAVLPKETPQADLTISRAELPADVPVAVTTDVPEQLTAAQGGMAISPSGCTSGFRVKTGSPPVWRLTSANHSTCGSGWGSVNGVTMTLQSGSCPIDTSFASGSPLDTMIDGHPFSGTQGNPASGALVYKYGVASGWTYGYRGVFSQLNFSCTVNTLTYTGGTIQSIPGDSGGPYITLVWNGSAYAYQARGTHRGNVGSTSHSIPIANIIATGWSVG